MHIPDNQLNASSILDNQHTVYRSRLNLPASGAYGGAWIPKFSDANQYIQVIFKTDWGRQYMFYVL